MSDLSYRVIPPEMVPDDMREKVAFVSGKAEEYERCRALAFGAIRRAAEVAREHDRLRNELLRDRPFTDYALWAKRHEMKAEVVREAIRAAIGSDKT